MKKHLQKPTANWQQSHCSRPAYYDAVHLQFTYMAAVKPLRVGEKFFDSLCRNIEKLGLPSKIELQLTALAIKAFGSKPEWRQELSCRALDALEYLFPFINNNKEIV